MKPTFIDYYEETELEESPIDVTQALEESLAFIRNTKGGKVKSALKGAASFFSKNPALTIAAATMAVDSYSKYKKNKRNTISLYAKDAYEKRMMTDVVKALTSSGRFKVERNKYASGGKVWVLKRIGS